MYPNVDFDSHTYISSLREPFPVSQTLVLQITNPGAEDLPLRNDTGQASFPLKPAETAQPIDGVTLFYLVFPLGDQESDFTTEERFEQMTVTLPNTLNYQRVGKNTIVLFPTSTFSLEQTDLLEILFGNVISMGPGEKMVCIDVFCLDGKTKTNLGRRALYRTAHPLSIGAFQLDRACEKSAFRDHLRFSYAVYGASLSLLTPGDTALSAQYPEEGGTLSVETTIYQPTFYGINAFQGEQMINAALECPLQKASIQSFLGTYTVNQDGTRDVTLKILVENTRHAYLSKIGRIPVTPGQACTTVLRNQSPDLTYTLAVENEEGLIRREVTWQS